MSTVARKGNSMARAEPIEQKAFSGLETNAVNNGENGAAGVEPTIDQVRELLFGHTQRENDKRAADLNLSIDALRKDMLERFAAMEARMDEMHHETARRHASTIEAIGGAIADLGAQVRKLAEPPARK